MKSNIFKELLESTDDMLSQLEDLISSLDQESYRKPLAILNGASLGEHVRHSLEFFFAYLKATRLGTVCYDRRDRDERIQTDPAFALDTVLSIREDLKTIAPERAAESVNVDVDWLDSDDSIPSTLSRELHYVQDHLLHHSALIKVGLLHGLENPTAPQIRDMEKLGVAPSTLAYQAGRSN